MVIKKVLAIIVACAIVGIPIFAYATLNVREKPVTTSTIDEVLISTFDEVKFVATEPPTEKPTEVVTEAPTEVSTEIPPEEIEVKVENNNPCAPIPPEEPDTGLNSSTSSYTYSLSEDERYIVECLVMGESGYMSYELQVLTAQCILNACLESGLKPSSVMDVYQYYGWNNNPTESVKSAVKDVFDNGYRLTDEPILFFYAPHLCTSSWHESQRYILTQDGIRFFARW